MVARLTGTTVNPLTWPSSFYSADQMISIWDEQAIIIGDQTTRYRNANEPEPALQRRAERRAGYRRHRE